MKLWKSLYFQVLVAILLGVLVGYFHAPLEDRLGALARWLHQWFAFIPTTQPNLTEGLKPLGDIFIQAVKLLSSPIIFCTVAGGLAAMSDLKKLGRVGWKALLYFEVVTTIALGIGLLVGRVFHPGTGIHADPAKLDTSSIANATAKAKEQGFGHFLFHTEGGHVLQILLLAVVLGIVLGRLGEKGKALNALIHRATHFLFFLVGIVTRFAPIAAFGAMAFTVGKLGIKSLTQLGWLMGCVYLTCILFVFVILGLIARVHGFSIWRLLKLIKEELFIVLGTSSSESALPHLMQKLEKNGCSESLVGIVVPAGYSFNLDGTSIYLTMAVLFIAQATDTPLTLWDECYVLLVLLLTSKGAAAVTGGGFITLAATLATTGKVPIAGLALIVGIDRFMSEARAITNLIGNSLATFIVAKWEGEFDPEKGAAILANPPQQQQVPAKVEDINIEPAQP